MIEIGESESVKAGRLIMEETRREMERQVKNHPNYLKMFREMEAAELKHESKKLVKTIQESYKLRFEVFKRDGFRCQYCGRSPKNDETVVLHLDHIHPKSKGGATTKDNLITSCLECNIGKGNRLL